MNKKKKVKKKFFLFIIQKSQKSHMIIDLKRQSLMVNQEESMIWSPSKKMFIVEQEDVDHGLYLKSIKRRSGYVDG